MDEELHILPIPDLSHAQNSEEMMHNLILDKKKDLKMTEERFLLFKNIYISLFTGKIEYDVIHSHLVTILNHIMTIDSLSDYIKIIEYIFKIELLCDNFYHRLKSSIQIATMNKYKISFLELIYPEIKRKNALDLYFLIEKIKNDVFLAESLAELVICYTVNLQLSKNMEDLVEENNSLIMHELHELLIFENILSLGKNPPFLLLYLLENDQNKYLRYLLKEDFKTSNHAFYFFDEVDFDFITEKFINELQKTEKIDFLMSNPSHFLINKFHNDLIHLDNFEELIVQSYSLGNLETMNLLHKIFEVDLEKGERILKMIILHGKEKRFKGMFLDKCKNIDLDFIEIFIMYLDNISSVKDEMFKNIIISPYFGILSKDLKIFKECINRSVNILHEINMFKIIDSIFYENMRIKDEVILKMEFLVQKFPNFKEYLFQKFKYIIKYVERKSNCINEKMSNINFFEQTKSSESFLSVQSSCEFKTNVYNLINIFRSESGVYEFVDIIMNYDFLIFLDNCLFTKFDRIDQFFIYFVNQILSSNEFSDNEYFLNNFSSYIRKIHDIDYYWNLTSKKLLNIDKLIIALSQIEDENFFIDYIYDEKHLMELLSGYISNYENSFEQIGRILKKLEKYSIHQTGITFYDSLIHFNLDSKNFCLYISAIQYDEDDIQSIVKFEGENVEIDILIFNGKIIEKIVMNNMTEKILLEGDVFTEFKILLGIKYSKGALKISLNSKKHVIKLRSISSITIGDKFKGIMQRIIWYENSHYKNEYLNDYSRTNLFINHLCDLQKKLIFRNENGFYIDNSTIYYFNKQLNVEVVNVLSNVCVKWVYNYNLCDKIFIEAKKNEKLANILEGYVERAYIDIKNKR